MILSRNSNTSTYFVFLSSFHNLDYMIFHNPNILFLRKQTGPGTRMEDSYAFLNHASAAADWLITCTVGGQTHRALKRRRWEASVPAGSNLQAHGRYYWHGGVREYLRLGAVCGQGAFTCSV